MSASVPWTDLGALVDAVRALDRRADDHERQLAQLLEAVRLVHDDDRTLRRELRAVRLTSAYAEAFESADPLVSVVVPTWSNAEGLRTRSLPSALAQTHERIEIVVVGDASPPEVEAAVRSLGDPRIRFHNLATRGPYPDDPREAWLSSGTPPYNAGVALARGSWIAPLADDDAFTPDHVERLLARARAERLEFVYGRFTRNAADSGETVVGAFPPQYAQIGMQMALYPSALRVFELELGDAVFEVPNDWGMIRRMLRAGVRFGMIDDVVTEYFPSMRAMHPSTRAASPVPESRLGEALAERIAELERRALAAEQALATVTESRSWRITRPLRDAAARRRRPRG